MLLLFETPAGFALFKVLDERKLSKVEDLEKKFFTTDLAKKVVRLRAFSKFENTAEALSETTLLIDSKLSKALRRFLRSHCDGETLAVVDSKLGKAIKKKLKIDCINNDVTAILMRGVRSQLSELVTDVDLSPMRLGLSHNLCRYKLGPDNDTLIIKGIELLDDIDKQLNIFAMRVQEWYGWHFPELSKIVRDNLLYAKTVMLMGDRSNASRLNFSEILTEEVEIELKEAAITSMGSEISELDHVNINDLCTQVVSSAEFRVQLFDSLKSKMNSIAPNLTTLVGVFVGSRLIAHAGSLFRLAMLPGSTIQMLGAKKSLFRSLKTEDATPKYGLIYNASLTIKAAPKNKGKISRSLACKIALAARKDALGDDPDNTMGVENLAKLNARFKKLEGKEFSGGASRLIDNSSKN